MCRAQIRRDFGTYNQTCISFTHVQKYDRGLQNRELLESLLADVTKARDELEPSPITSRRPRLVLKIAPDLQESQIAEMAEVIRNSAIDGVIVSNTTVTRPSSLVDRE